jgi:eukaryotic-like serine/threonine-protein kinase
VSRIWLMIGLAKPLAMASGSAAAPVFSATMSSPISPITLKGTIIGTIQYMSPEQIEGKEADARSDIFAFGCVLYEMATGQRAFQGKSNLSVASAILEKDPEPISAQQPLTPPALEHLVHHCLEKRPDERLQSARDAAWALRDISSSQLELKDIARTGKSSAMKIWMVAAVATVLAVALIAELSTRTPPPRSMRFTISLPVLARDMALTEDGEWMAFVAPDETTGRSTLYVHRIGTSEFRRLDGTERASYPFWSPDEKQIGFFADQRLKKIAAAGGSATELAKVGHGRGGSWGSQGEIIYAPDTNTGIWKIGEDGGTPELVTHFNAATNASHRWPQFLPDGMHFLFLVPDLSGPSGGALFAASTDAGQYSKIADSDTNAAYVEPGYLVFARSGTLMAQRFDAKSLRTLAPPFAIASDAQMVLSVFRSEFTASRNGTILMGTSLAPRETQLTWFDRSGKRLGSVGEPAIQSNPVLSLDGKHLAFDSADPTTSNIDVFVQDLQQSTRTRLTFSPAEDVDPVWEPSGNALYYRTIEPLNQVDRVELSTTARRKVMEAPGSQDVIPNSVAPSGILGLVSINNQDGTWRLQKFYPGSGKSEDFIGSDSKNGIISPDGRWAAYVSRDSGLDEVYVTSFHRGEGKWQVSHGGGEEPRWRHDGKELFFLGPHNVLYAVPIRASESFGAGTPAPLFTAPAREPISSTDFMNYDVSADGQRFIVNKPLDASAAPPLKIILNWPAEVAK